MSGTSSATVGIVVDVVAVVDTVLLVPATVVDEVLPREPEPPEPDATVVIEDDAPLDAAVVEVDVVDDGAIVVATVEVVVVVVVVVVEVVVVGGTTT
jgi:hypothetical protein